MSSTDKELIDSYINWLKEEITVTDVNGWSEITTPFLDVDNDYIQIYARVENGLVTLTDDGDTIRTLKMSGCDLTSPNRERLLNFNINRFGLKLKNGDELWAQTPLETFPQKKNDLIQAIQSIGDLFYTSRSTVQSMFYEDVVSWFDEINLRYTKDINLTGRSGVTHAFDFIIPHSREQPERIVKVINIPRRSEAESYAFRWNDISTERPSETIPIAIVNDAEQKIPKDFTAIIQSSNITCIRFSERADYVNLITA